MTLRAYDAARIVLHAEASAIRSVESGKHGAASRARQVAKQLLPPIVLEGIRRAIRRSSGQPEWEYCPSGWPADATKPGWDSESVVSTQLARWPAFAASAEGPAPFGLSNEAAAPTEHDYGTHNTIMSFGYVLGRAAQGQHRLSMLDWGGGVGHYYVYARALLPEAGLEYHCRDLPRFAAAGRQVLPQAKFHDVDETALARSYDLVLASSSLHYSQDWRATLAGLASVTGRYLYVTRQPLVETEPSFVVVQRPHRYGYMTEYPGWFLNRGEFLSEAGHLGLELLREFLIAERPLVAGAPEQADYRGFLFAAPSGSAKG
jgi:putative methyltransferase (TIGR04325 family)